MPTAHQIGVNLAQAEFGDHTRPGTYGKDYAYPTKAEMKVYADHGVDLIRLPFLLERVQATPGGPVVLEQAADGRRVGILQVLDDAASLGMKVLLDMHNYWRAWGKIIGDPGAYTHAQFGDVWGKIAAQVKGKPALLGYELNNEPNGVSLAQVQPGYQAAVDAILAVDTAHEIHLGGLNWSGAHSWSPVKVTVPAEHKRLIIYHAHQYFDRDSSGVYGGGYDASSPDAGVQRLQPFLKFLVAEDAQGFIGETGVPSNDPRWLEVQKRFNDACIASGRIRVTGWGGGPWWPGNYSMAMFAGGVPTSYFNTLKPYFGGTNVMADQATVTMRRTSPETIAEGQSIGLEFVIDNGKVGQSFLIVQEGEMDAADFSNTLAASFAGIAGISYAQVTATSGKVTLTKDGDFTFAAARPTVNDGSTETTDKAGWVPGNQEQTNFKLTDLTGGLLTSTAYNSNWVTDQGGTVPPPVTPPIGPTEVDTLKAKVAELEKLLAASEAARATAVGDIAGAKQAQATAEQALAAAKARIVELEARPSAFSPEERALVDKMFADANLAENDCGRVMSAARRLKKLMA